MNTNTIQKIEQHTYREEAAKKAYRKPLADASVEDLLYLLLTSDGKGIEHKKKALIRLLSLD